MSNAPLQCCSHLSNGYVSIQCEIGPFWNLVVSDLESSKLALDNIKTFDHDDWQLSPENIGLEWDVKGPTDDDLIEDDDFDPEEAYNHMVDMMGRFRAH